MPELTYHSVHHLTCTALGYIHKVKGMSGIKREYHFRVGASMCGVCPTRHRWLDTVQIVVHGWGRLKWLLQVSGNERASTGPARTDT
jgi:hypothetical protein